MSRRLLLALLGLLVLLLFDGRLSLGGSEEGDEQEAAGRVVQRQLELQSAAAPKAEFRPEPLPDLQQDPSSLASALHADTLAGLRAQIDWLFSERRLPELRALARRYEAKEESPELRQLGSEALRRIDLEGQALEQQLRDALAAGDLPLAEERLLALRANWTARAERFVASLPSPAAEPESAPVSELLRPLLPLTLSPGRILARVRNQSGILRERGKRAWRYRRVPLASLSPLQLYESIGESRLELKKQQAACDGLARLYLEAGRPIAAALVLCGQATLPAGPAQGR
ncbi:MAG: hypothetical protein CSA62_06190 [Planctomycetota bacterium]|nr:MAG: hypothetical protein CSA62_06190 [Planctomycetota bacterium]